VTKQSCGGSSCIHNIHWVKEEYLLSELFDIYGKCCELREVGMCVGCKIASKTDIDLLNVVCKKKEKQKNRNLDGGMWCEVSHDACINVETRVRGGGGLSS